MLPLAPAKTAKMQSGDAVSRVMTDCERIEPFYAHTIAPAVTAIAVPLVILGWVWGTVFLVNILMKEASMSRYSEWDAYVRSSSLLFPWKWFLGRF